MGEGEEKERIRVCKEGELSHDPLSYDTSNQTLTFLCINFSNGYLENIKAVSLLLLSIEIPQLEFGGHQCPMAP